MKKVKTGTIAIRERQRNGKKEKKKSRKKTGKSIIRKRKK